MAELSVQPKKRKTHPLLWLLAAIIILTIILLLQRSCNTPNDSTAVNTDTSAAVGATTPSAVTSDTTAAGRTPGADDWDDVEKNAPNASYQEVTDKNIGVRGNNNYGIYDLGSDILFDLNSS